MQKTSGQESQNGVPILSVVTFYCHYECKTCAGSVEAETEAGVEASEGGGSQRRQGTEVLKPVSYTHLTLPTIYSV